MKKKSSDLAKYELKKSGKTRIIISNVAAAVNTAGLLLGYLMFVMSTTNH